MFLLEFIDPFVFFISFFIGILIVYSMNPKPKVIIQYPKMETLDTTTYKKDDNTCFKYKSVDTKCKFHTHTF